MDYPSDAEIEDVMHRFLADINDSIEGVNMALPYFGKTLKSLTVDGKTGNIDLEIEEKMTVH